MAGQAWEKAKGVLHLPRILPDRFPECSHPTYTETSSRETRGTHMAVNTDAPDGAGLPASEMPEVEPQPTFPLFAELPPRNRPPVIFQRSDWP